MQNDIIASTATAPGAAALALVRLSGPGCAGIVEECMKLAPGRLLGMRRAAALFRSDGGTSIDSVVAFSWPPGTGFTGEESVEITCHGAPGVTEAITGELIARGARQALPGEFTRRAMAAGRIGPLDVISLAGRYGRLDSGSDLGAAGAELLRSMEVALEEIEGSVEFGDTGAGTDPMSAVDTALAGARRFEEASDSCEAPGRLYITGPVNAGKSSLFNLLTGRETALVSVEPGTTREGLVATARIGGGTIEVRDTAGTGGSGLDGAALARAVEGMRRGDSVIWLSPGSRETPPASILEKDVRLLEMSSRSDEIPPSGRALSLVTGEGLSDVREWIAAGSGDGTCRRLAMQIRLSVETASGMLRAGEHGLASEELEDAVEILGGLLDSGRGAELSVESALSRLCVGK